ncbi:maleylpyruvate isomerase family mycothiol-dependent enzyme [Georgenia subflava]
MIHSARRSLAEDLAHLGAEQWHTPSLCSDWDVEHVVAHLTAGATVGRLRWLRSIVGARFRPAVHNERRLREQLGATPAQTLERFRAVVESTTAPSKDTAAYLGEVLVHSQDVRVPLGIQSEPDVDALTHVAHFFARRDFAVQSRSMVRGLRLRATDGRFAVGDGPAVEGPTLALVMTMAGRDAYVGQLDGPGRTTVEGRLGTGPASG